MFCVYCGKKLEKDAKFCQNCGKPVDSPKKTTRKTTKKIKIENDNRSDSAIRKAIKAAAKAMPKTQLILLALISVAISVVYLMAMETNNNLGLTFIAFTSFAILTLIINFGITFGALQISRGKNVGTGEILSGTCSKFKNIALYILFVFAIFVAYILLLLIPILNILVLMVSFVAIPILAIYFYPVFDILKIILMDEKDDEPFMDCLKKAFNLVKGKRLEYYGMYFSFIGWKILNIFTFNILSLWIMPYQKLAVTNMYRRWLNEANFEGEESGLTNIIAGYFFFVVFISVIVLAIIVFGEYTNSLDKDKITHYEFDFNNYYNEIIDDIENGR